MAIGNSVYKDNRIDVATHPEVRSITRNQAVAVEVRGNNSLRTLYGVVDTLEQQLPAFPISPTLASFS